MPRKTPLMGFNLFWHNEPVISLEDINPDFAGASPDVQPDPQNTLNYNFKRMDYVLQSILDGALAFNTLRTTQDVISGRDVIVGRNLIIQGNIELPRDETPTPHIILDFGDALTHSGVNDNSLSVTVAGASAGAAGENPFKPGNEALSLNGALTYPIIFNVGAPTTFWDSSISAIARLFLAFNAPPQNLSSIVVAFSYDGGSTFPTSYTYTGSEDLGDSFFLSPQLVVSNSPTDVRVTLNGTNDAGVDFDIRRVAVLSPAVPALENFYVSQAGGAVYGALDARDITTPFGNVFKSEDEWLRFNDGNGHTSGVYFGNSLVRTDGSLQIGNGGSVLNISNSVFTYNGTDITELLGGSGIDANDVLADTWVDVNDDGINDNAGLHNTNVQAALDSLNYRIDQMITGATTTDIIIANDVTINESLDVTNATTVDFGSATFSKAQANTLAHFVNTTSSWGMKTYWDSSNNFMLLPNNASGVDVASDALIFNPTTGVWNAAGGLQSGGNTVLTTANEGSGNGIDADTIDGLHASSFATSGHTHSYALNDLSNVSAASPSSGQALVWNGTAWANATIASGSMTAAEILTALKTVDGVGSGLDADLLDGLSSSSYALANHTHNNYLATTGGTLTGNLSLGTSDITRVDDIFLDDQLVSYGDTDTYFQFHAANQCRIVVGGVEKFEVNTSDGVLVNDIRVTGNLVIPVVV